MNVIEFEKTNPNIGLITRQTVPGPEKELVESFSIFIPACFRWKAGEIALFYEPQIQTTFPDIVAVQYNPAVFDFWQAPRSDLSTFDIRLMHHLVRTRGANSDELMRDLGINLREIALATAKLIDAELVTRRNGRWLPRPTKSIFAVKSIVAIEAKIKNLGQAFNQSLANQWFASESYVLSSVEKPRRAVVDQSAQTGIGILLMNGKRVRHFQKARRQTLPNSFGSWLFNEWIGRYLNN